jgi:chromosome partitioning protein
MRIIAFANQKGGCGKTTAATNLAAALTQCDRKVLLIDNDPQGHATLSYGLQERDFSLSSYDLYLTTDILVEDAFVDVAPGLHLVPAGVELSAVEQVLAMQAEKELRLRQSLHRSAMPYDYVLLDCPPSVGLLTFNALLASQEVVIPVEPSHYSLQAVRKLYETLAVLGEQKGHALKPHLLLSNFDPRPRLAQELATELEQTYGAALLETVVHRTIRYQEAARAGLPVARYDPASRGALDFRLLAQEILAQEADLGDDVWDHWDEILRGPQCLEEGVKFVAEFPSARTVRLTGSFCDWSAEGILMARCSEQLWECWAPLPAGSHEYRYIVDGRWVSDPHNKEAVANEFGETNSLITLP